MIDVVLFGQEQFQQMQDESLIMRLLIRLNNTLNTGTRFLTYAVVEEGRECFTWNIVGSTDGTTFSHIRWVPSVEHPLSVTRRDDILSGDGACALIPMVLNVASSPDGVVSYELGSMKISGAGIGILELV